jgi:DNA-directed RNA polymerase specialized sigma24 family protein
MPQRLSDEEYKELGIQVSRDNGEAFQKLRRHLEKKLLGFIRSKIYNKKDAEKIAEKTWEYSFDRRESFNPDKSKYFTVLVWKADKLVIDYFRKQGRALKRHKRGLGNESTKKGGDNSAPPVSGEPSRLIYSSPHAKAVLKELLELAFKCPVKPHQLLVLGFRVLGWKPRNILAELSNLTLFDLATKLTSDASQYFLMNEQEAALLFEPIVAKLTREVAATYIEHEYNDSGLWNRYGEAQAGDIQLKDFLYYMTPKRMYDWMNKIRNKLEKELKKKGIAVKRRKRAAKGASTKKKPGDASKKRSAQSS